MTETTPQEDKYSVRGIVNNVNPNDRVDRVPYGSKREFHLDFISKNWARSNQEIGAVLGVTSGSVSRLRKLLRERPQMIEMAFNDYMVLKSDPGIPKTVLYNGAVKLLTTLLNDADRAKDFASANVCVQIVDVQSSSK